MSASDKLKAKRKDSLPVDTKSSAAELSEIGTLIVEINNDLKLLAGIYNVVQKKKDDVKRIKKDLMIKLFKLDKKEKQLLKEKSMTFEEFLKLIGISKGYYSESKTAYNFAIEYKKEELFYNIDSRILYNISKEDKTFQDELVEIAPQLTRKYFKELQKNESDFYIDPLKNELEKIFKYHGKEKAMIELNKLVQEIIDNSNLT